MSALEEVVRLRWRANSLRGVAAQIEETGVMVLDALAGDLTWRGPGPDLCSRMLRVNQHQLRLAVEELRRRSALLDRQAIEIEAHAAAAAASIGVQ